MSNQASGPHLGPLPAADCAVGSLVPFIRVNGDISSVSPGPSQERIAGFSPPAITKSLSEVCLGLDVAAQPVSKQQTSLKT